MLRTLVAGTAIAAALSLGAAGIAGADTTTSTTPTTAATGAGSSSTGTPKVCSKLPTVVARVQKRESALNARLGKAQARETKLAAAGHTKLADALKNRITHWQTRESRVNARLAKAQTRCGTTSTTTPTTAAS